MTADMVENVMFENVHGGHTTISLEGKDALLEQALSVLDLFASHKQTMTSIQHRGNISEITIDYEAKIAKDIPNGLMKGQELRLKGKSIFEFSEDGKIVKLGILVGRRRINKEMAPKTRKSLPTRTSRYLLMRIYPRLAYKLGI